MFVLKWARLSEHTSAQRVGLQPGGCQEDGNKAGHEHPPEKTHKAEDKEVGVIIQLVLGRLPWDKQVPTNKGAKAFGSGEISGMSCVTSGTRVPFLDLLQQNEGVGQGDFWGLFHLLVSKLKSPKCARRFTLLIISKCCFHSTVSFDPSFTKSVNDFILVRCHMHTTTLGA